MDKELNISLAKRYSELVSQQISAKYIVLYGSYAKGAATSDSDIDMAVIVETLDSDYLDEHAKLFRLRRSVDFRIEPVLSEYGIEYGKDRSGFLREVMDTGHILYRPAVQQSRNYFLPLLDGFHQFLIIQNLLGGIKLFPDSYTQSTSISLIMFFTSDISSELNSPVF